MKKIQFIIAIFLTATSFSQKKDTINTSANLVKATVYYGFGADLNHNAKPILVKGLQEVIIDNVALTPDINTFQISCPENITILSYKHRIYQKPPVIKPNPNESKALDSIKKLEKSVVIFNNELNISEDAIKRLTNLIEINVNAKEKYNIQSEDLIKIANYYTEKISFNKQRVFSLTLKRDSCNQKIDEIRDRLNEFNTQIDVLDPPKQIGQIILQVMSSQAGPANIDFNYFTANAGWTPSYDLRIKSLDNSFKIVYKGLVFQTTGLNWNGVKLNLSTNNPNQGNNLPEITPTFLQLFNPIVAYNNVQLKSVNVMAAPVMDQEDVMVSGYASKKMVRDVKKETVADYVTLKESQLNTNFEINLPYDIPCDGIGYSVNIKEENINVTYQHTAVPKLDNDAFLIARLSSWDSLNLMPGEANVIMDNVFLGKSYLDPNTTSDTLNFSLGRDKRISIDRKQIKDYKAPKRNDFKTESFTYEITIKNNKKQSVEMMVKDQYPISQVKEIEVSLTDNGEADVNTETGIMSWMVKLKPGESKKLRFSYQIKYPKDKILQEYK